MMRSAALALLLIAPVLHAAPVPKEVRAAPAYIGVWQLATPDPNDPSKLIPVPLYWHIDAECGVAFGARALGEIKPTERFAFDPRTGHVNHARIGGAQRTLSGIYKIEGDLLTIKLDTRNPSIRPTGIAPEPGYSIWRLLKAEGAK